MPTPKTLSIQLPPLSDNEAEHLLDALHDLIAIVDAYYRVPVRPAGSAHTTPASSHAPHSTDTDTIDLFDNALPF